MMELLSLAQATMYKNTTFFSSASAATESFTYSQKLSWKIEDKKQPLPAVVVIAIIAII